MYFPAMELAGVRAFTHSWKQVLYYFRGKVARFLFEKDAARGRVAWGVFIGAILFSGIFWRGSICFITVFSTAALTQAVLAQMPLARSRAFFPKSSLCLPR